MKSRIIAAVVVAWAMLTCSTGRAADTEGCLNCHQYRGLARIADNGSTISHFYVDPGYYKRGLGPHARLRCTDCHDARSVQVFPHGKAAPVNCTKACHLESAGKLEIQFSHQRVDRMIQGSVHGGEVLAKSNQLLGGLLRDGQAKCLLCHDEPTFAKAGLGWQQSDAPIGRCNTCHGDELPRDVQFSYWHVHARSQPARSHLDVVKVCGACHSDPRIQAEFKLPDAIFSYLASFHGKANLLGSEDAAGCLDCHVGALQNVHLMQAKDKPAASTNPRQLGDTCRSATCHPTAGAQISSAAIHLNLPTSRGVEYLIACAFVVLILTTFGPSLLLTILKLLQIVVGRKDEHHEHHLHVANQLMANPEGRRKLQRFTLHQRFQHWFLVLTFTTLVVTGFPIKFADREWAAWVVHRIFGSLPTVRNIHHWAGALLMAGMVYHLVYVFLHILKVRRQTGKSLFRIIWGLPMLPRPGDMLEMNRLLLYVLFLKKTRPAGERFNPEEKFEYIGVFWGCIVLGVTGVIMWANAWSSHFLPGRVLTVALLIHTFEAFLALLHVGIVHMASVIFAPGVFPISRAMFSGDTPAEELVEGHGAMLAEVEKEMKGVLVGEGTHHG